LSPPQYEPQPIATAGIDLGDDLLQLTELLARNAHDVWALGRIHEGWQWGPQRDDVRKLHPSLVPYEQLPESEKDYDRNAAMETLKAIVAYGYRIIRSE
jgi:hypothetical protein